MRKTKGKIGKINSNQRQQSIDTVEREREREY